MCATEHIPDEDDIWRHLFAPAMQEPAGNLRWENVFMFKSQFGYNESVAWSKYADLNKVHELGCKKQSNDRGEGKQTTYIGAICARVARIRTLKSKNGVGFEVIHDPSGDQGMHHAHIRYAAANAAPNKNDKSELKVLLREIFSEPHEHACPEEAAAKAA